MQRSPEHETIPDGWQRVRLGDVTEIKGGTGFPPGRQGRTSGDYPFIKVSDMTLKGNETYIRVANNYVDEHDVLDLTANVFSPGTVVFPKVGAAIATNKKRALTASTIIDNNMVGVTVSDEERCDARFLHNWFESVNIAQFANVSTVPSITASRLKAEPILLPPLPEQRAIAAVLDSLDDAIEGAEAVIAATEGLRDSLLHDLLTRGLPGQHTEFRDVPGLGTIPADWEVVWLGDVTEVTSGIAMGPHRIPQKNPKPYLTVANVQTDKVTIDANRLMEVADSEYQSRYLRAGDVVLVEGHAQISQLGRAAIVPPEAEGFTFQNHLFRVRTGELCDAKFVAAYVNGHGGRRYFGSFGGTTSGLNTVSAANVKALPMPFPSLTEQQAIAAVLDGVDGAIAVAREEAAGLRLLKESIADALLTGRIRIKDMR